jgi:hypothetical protein
MVWVLVPLCASVVVPAPCARVAPHGPRTNQSRKVVVRGGDLSCEAACRVRRRLVVRGGDCRGDPSCRELVGDAASWPETGHLASVGLDQGPQSSSS